MSNTLNIKHLPELVAQEIITEETALKIEHYLKNKPASYNRLLTIFGVLGALLVGLGILLIIAHNWDDFTKTTKTILSFCPMIAGQIIVIFTFFKKRNIQSWTEGASTFLYLTIGGCIAMISQIYHIQGNEAIFYLTWTLLGLPLVYILRSSMSTILYIIGLTTFSVYSWDIFHGVSALHYLYWPLLVLIIPHYIRLVKHEDSNFASFLNWIIPISISISIGQLSRSAEMIQFLNFLILFTIFNMIGRTGDFSNISLAKNGYKIIGTIGTIFIAFCLSFQDIWEDVINDFSENDYLNHYEFHGLGVLFIVGLGVLAWHLIHKRHKTLGPLPYFFVLIIGFLALGENGYLILNVPLLTMSIYFIWLGAKESRLRTLNLGIISLSALIICRFFDLDIDYITRGVVFVLMGIGFFIINLNMIRRKKKQNESESKIQNLS